ncbi:TPA: alcohol dehydrogenase catalytic domain-containing protein [Candidatus Galligastranaerophilus intestinigallinarum]|nr:alcohol dehydrogenase catalytic domain-containing protein [Candidatus Galligastranaerophilus intestinigallinarum]
MKMKAIMFYAPKDIRYEEVNVPEPNEGEVLVKVEAALTCGTDVKTYRRGHPVLIKKTPSGFGHEFSGTIAKLGENVEGFNVGDRVVAANSAPCGECFFCKKGEENLCENLELLNGAYAQYILIPKNIVQKNLIKIPENLPFKLAAFTEPLSNVVHGISRTPINKGDTVGVIGIGPIGLMFCALAKLKGAKVIAMGRNPLKLKLAKEFAHADEVIDLKKYNDPTEIILSMTEEKRGLDVAIECVGLPEIWESMFKIVRRGGCVHLFGGCASGTSVNIDTKRLHYDEVNIISVFHHTPKYFREALNLIATKQIDVEKLITKTLPLKYTKRALEMQQNGEAIKVLIEP